MNNMIFEHIKNKKLAVRVKPNAKKTEVIEFDKDKHLLNIAIKAPADKNLANIELLKFLTKETGKKARIRFGLTSKEKIIEFS
jgi:uncharacterized protein (TIGR00251 family)